MPTHKSTTFEGQCFYIGIDVHLSSWSLCIRTLGMELKRFSQPPDAGYLARYLREHYPGGTYLSAYEAGFSGTSAHHQLIQAGITNIIIHPADLPKTDKQKKNKTDTHDSRAIANYLERGMLRGIYIMPVELQELRALFRQRQAKMKDVVRSTNRIKGYLYFLGVPIPESFQRTVSISGKMMKWLETVELKTANGTMVLKQYLEDFQLQRQHLTTITKRFRQAIQLHHKERYSSLLTVPGFGPIVSAALLAEVGEMERFDDPDEYTSFIGILPREHSSGDKVQVSGLQPRCNKFLRPLLIEAAWQAIRRSPQLLAYYRKHVARNNKKAIVKVARRLALIAKSVAIHKTAYQEDYEVQKKMKNVNAILS